MSSDSKIEWTDSTWNPIRARNLKTGKVGWHCEHATTGCEFCYAEGFNKRLGTGLSFKPGHRKDIEIFLDENMLTLPLRWKRPRMIFLCSMTDLFADFVPDEWIDRVFAVMALSPQHTFQVLTKRAERMRGYLSMARAHPVGLEALGISLDAHIRDEKSTVGAGCILQGDIAHLQTWPLPNVWLGVSAERQQEADERIPLLLQTPAAIRFMSLEPLLGPIDLRLAKWNEGRELSGFLDWAIIGGESGPCARPMHPDWARSLKVQCEVSAVKFFFKQWGSWYPAIDRDCDDPDWRRDYACTNHYPGRFQILNLAGGHGFHGERVHLMQRYSKKSCGRLLDGIEHNAMPERGA